MKLSEEMYDILNQMNLQIVILNNDYKTGYDESIRYLLPKVESLEKQNEELVNILINVAKEKQYEINISSWHLTERQRIELKNIERILYDKDLGLIRYKSD
jgi:hypothetical protein